MLVIDQLKKGDSALQKIALMIFCAMFVLVLRLWYVQIVKGKEYTESHMDQSFRTVRIPAVRGKILDRNGTPIAENRPNYTVSVYVEELRKQFQAEYVKQYRAQTNALHRKLTKDERDKLEVTARYNVVSNIGARVGGQIGQAINVDQSKFNRHYETRRILPFPLTANLNSVQIARFEEQPINGSGLDLELQPVRVYPAKQAGAHWLGYLVRNNDSKQDEKSDFDYRLVDFKGEIGIEGAFDEELHGKAGEKWVTVNRLGYRQHESIKDPAEAGKNVILTIDLNIQKAAESALRTSFLGGDAKAAAVVMNVNSGDIIAMASNPTFDPNGFITGMRVNERDRLIDESLKPQLNRAVQGVYPPGSIFKIVSGLAALENGLDPKSIYRVQVDPARAPKGCIYVGGSKIEDLAEAGDYDFQLAFARSSNAYFIDHGLHVGIKQIIDMGNRFFLGQSTELPLGIKTQKGIFPSLQWISKNGWSDGDTANICIGQGRLAVTPVQMAVMTSAIANGGKVYKPRLVQRIEPQEEIPTETTVQEFPPVLRGDLHVRASNLQIVREAMLADTEDPRGSAYKAFHKSGERRLNEFKVCGKTGTAEVIRPGFKDHITWFVSYAPYENPRYAVVVMVESGSSGGGTCAPVAEKIYRELEKLETPGATTDRVAAL